MIQLKENNKTTQPEISGVGTENVFLITCRVSRRLSLMLFVIHLYIVLVGFTVRHVEPPTYNEHRITLTERDLREKL